MTPLYNYIPIWIRSIRPMPYSITGLPCQVYIPKTHEYLLNSPVSLHPKEINVQETTQNEDDHLPFAHVICTLRPPILAVISDFLVLASNYMHNLIWDVNITHPCPGRTVKFKQTIVDVRTRAHWHLINMTCRIPPHPKCLNEEMKCENWR